MSQTSVWHCTEASAVAQVLDALMNHLEETLEVVLSRGETPALDNKVSRPPILSSVWFSWFVFFHILFWFSFCSW